jgi:hypothetical protein
MEERAERDWKIAQLSRVLQRPSELERARFQMMT